LLLLDEPRRPGPDSLTGRGGLFLSMKTEPEPTQTFSNEHPMMPTVVFTVAVTVGAPPRVTLKAMDFLQRHEVRLMQLHRENSRRFPAPRRRL
jgi:hypothetical protein